MRISDWSSDVCSSDLQKAAPFKRNDAMLEVMPIGVIAFPGTGITENLDRKSVVSGKSVSVRVDLGGRRTIKNTKQHQIYRQKYEQINLTNAPTTNTSKTNEDENNKQQCQTSNN